MKKKSSDQIRRLNLINLAIAHKFSGDKGECERVLQEEDWSSCKDSFRLAVAVLQNQYDEAARVMNKIGSKGEVTRTDYSSWPLFKDFRQSKEFLQAYRSLFGEEFVVPEESELKTEMNKKPIKHSRETRKKDV